MNKDAIVSELDQILNTLDDVSSKYDQIQREIQSEDPGLAAEDGAHILSLLDDLMSSVETMMMSIQGVEEAVEKDITIGDTKVVDDVRFESNMSMYVAQLSKFTKD